MHTLRQMSYEEKARLMHQLLPEQMPALVNFIAEMGRAIREDETRNRRQWKNTGLRFDVWLTLADEVGVRIYRNGRWMHKRCKVFASELFVEPVSLFTLHCIEVYRKTNRLDDKLELLLRLLFE